MDRHQELDARIERAMADLERRLRAARRRERFSVASLMAAFAMALTGWTPLLGQAPKSMEERVTDLEKRTGGVQIDDGVTKLTAPLQVLDNRGQVVMVVESSDDGGTLSIGGTEKGYVRLGTGLGGNGQLRLYGSDRKMSLHLGNLSGLEGRGLFLMDKSGSEAQASLTIDGDNLPNFEVGNRASGSVRVTVADGGPGIVSVRDDQGVPGMVIGAVSDKLGLYALDESARPLASFRADTLGGRIQVHNLRGEPVGGLFSEPTGGGLVLTDENGGYSVVDLGVRAGGGSIRIHSVGGGPARAVMEADDKLGAFSVYATNGDVAATLAPRPGGSGYLQLLYKGVTMVDAGMNTDEVGVVRAGPSSQKTVGVLSIPYRLVGRK